MISTLVAAFILPCFALLCFVLLCFFSLTHLLSFLLTFYITVSQCNLSFLPLPSLPLPTLPYPTLPYSTLLYCTLLNSFAVVATPLQIEYSVLRASSEKPRDLSTFLFSSTSFPSKSAKSCMTSEIFILTYNPYLTLT